MTTKNHVVLDEVLSKEFLSQFKTEADVSNFIKQLHAQVLEKMLEGKMDVHLGYEKNSVAGNHSSNSRNGKYLKTIQTEHGESSIFISRDRNGEFEPIGVPKHGSRGLSIERLLISFCAKGMSVSDIKEEMCEIYGIDLSTSAIFIITNKVSQVAQEWQNRPLDPVYLLVWMDGIVFKVRDNGKVIKSFLNRLSYCRRRSTNFYFISPGSTVNSSEGKVRNLLRWILPNCLCLIPVFRLKNRQNRVPHPMKPLLPSADMSPRRRHNDVTASYEKVFWW